MGFPKPTLTDIGKQVLLKSIAGKKLIFSSIKIGSGKVSAATDLTKRTSLVNQIHSFSIVNAKKGTDTVELTTTFSNAELNTDFEFREIGVFAYEPDTGAEILYCYSNCGDKSEYIQATSVDYVEKTIRVSVAIGNAENVSVIINPDLNYITRSEEQELRNSDVDGVLSAMLYGCTNDFLFGDGYLIVGNSKTEIGHEEYANNTEIKAVFIPEGITKIGRKPSDSASGYSFYGCSNLRKISFPGTLQKIEQYAFARCSILDDVNLHDNIDLSSGVFYYCISLSNIRLPEGITRIPENTFSFCKTLSNIEIPSGVMSIGGSAFSSCESLTRIRIPSNVTTIGNYAFLKCKSLRSVIIENTNEVITLSSTNVFDSTPIELGTGFIFVPDELVESYKTATNWTVYADQIKGISEVTE